jgi:hypothetical protein
MTQNTMIRLREQRAKAALNKLNPVETKYTTPSLSSLSDSIVDESDGPDPADVVTALFEIWPVWYHFDDEKQSILYGVVDYFLYEGYTLTVEMKMQLRDVVDCLYHKETGMSAIKGPMGDATQISNIIIAVLENVNHHVPMQPPRERKRANGPPRMQTAPGISRPRLSYPNFRVTPHTDRNQTPRGDRSARCETDESEIRCREPTTWVTGDTSIVWNCSTPKRQKKKVRFTDTVTHAP